MRTAGSVLFTASVFSHIQRFHLPYLRWFREQGWRVHVACGGPLREIPEADRVISIPLEKKTSAPSNFRAALMLRRLIGREHYDLISTHTSLAAFFTRAAVMGMARRPKLVNTVHGYLFDGETPAFKRTVLLAAEKLTAGQTDLLLTMNRWDFELARSEHLGKRIAAIPGMGVDFSRLVPAGPSAGPRQREAFGIGPDAFVMVYPAEFSQRKSQSVLIRAMAALPEAAVLVLPGEGDTLEACRTLAAQLALGGRVVFPGETEDMAAWYAAADAAVPASRSEGMPFNVMEAMHAGLPVIASAVKGHTDLIRDGESGILYPYGDEAAFAAAARRLMESPALCGALGKAASAAVAPYSLARVFPQVTAELEALIEPRLAP